MSKSIRIRPCYWPRTSPSDQSPVSDRHAHTHICGKTRARHNFPIQIAISRCRLGTYVQLLRCNCLSCLARAKCGFLKHPGMGRGGRTRARRMWVQAREIEAKSKGWVRRMIRSMWKWLTRPCFHCSQAGGLRRETVGRRAYVKRTFSFRCYRSNCGRRPTYSGQQFPIGHRDLQELVRAVSARSRSSESRGTIGYRLTSTGQ